MESGSAAVQREERKRKYQIYVEEYVMSYLRREADSLELSEIYFYGSRQDNGRKILVYGAGRDKRIDAFAKYEPLPELLCRLTQAGPVFMVREENGECRTSGFQIFYENNEAMQNYLLEWTGSIEQGGAKKPNEERTALPVLISPEEFPKKEVHGAISVQLCLILMVLTAIVITATNSYDKMEQLNQSAKEVFFAIENQEAEDNDENFENVEKSDQIVVERDMKAEREAAEKSGNTSAESDDKIQSNNAGDGKEETQEESNSESAQEKPQEKADSWSGEGEATDESNTESAREGSEKDEAGEEALSRSITRYYEVEQGDTLYTISQKIYGNISKVDEICEVNEITDPDRIRSGQRIILP